MNYTPEQLAALPDIELNLLIARDVAGLKAYLKTYKDPFDAELPNLTEVRIYTKHHGDGRYSHLAPDYLSDLNTIDDLCKEKGMEWQKGSRLFACCHILWNYVITVEIRKGEFPRCRFLCEALVLAWQESKK